MHLTGNLSKFRCFTTIRPWTPNFFSVHRWHNSWTEQSLYHLYADDLQMYQQFFATQSDNTFSLMNCDIEATSSLAFKHGLTFNETKTQGILIGHPRIFNEVNVETFATLRLNNLTLDYREKWRTLGSWWTDWNSGLDISDHCYMQQSVCWNYIFKF